MNSSLRPIRATRGRRNVGPTLETGAKLRPDPILALYRAGTLSRDELMAATEIRDIIERGPGPIHELAAGAAADNMDGKPALNWNRHPLDGIKPSVPCSHLDRYVPSGADGRRAHIG